MNFDILFAGFGGQGVQFAAKVTAYAGMYAEKEVSLLPSYGPEVRGGTSNCAVKISDGAIAVPIVGEPDILMVLNEPSFIKFIGSVRTGGTVIYDDSLITSKTDRTDIKLFGIPATQIAKENGLTGLANIIALGYMTKITGFLPLDQVKVGLEKSVPANKSDMIEKNFKAVEIGYTY